MACYKHRSVTSDEPINFGERVVAFQLNLAIISIISFNIGTVSQISIRYFKPSDIQ